MLGPAEWAAVLLSLKVGLAATAATLPPAYALAYLLARRRFPGRMLLDALIHLPLVLPPVVIGYLLLVAFGRNGALGFIGQAFMFRWTGAAVAAAIMGLPLMVRAMRLSIEGVDRRLVGAARTLGASRLRAFVGIVLPLSLPGVLAGTVLGFAKSMGEFGATITFVSNIPGETQTLPLAIYSLLQVPGAEPQVLRLALLSIALSLGALIASEALMRRAGRHRTNDEL
jgi:molybdate transport system permease protein